MEMTTEMVSLLFPLLNSTLGTGVWTARFTAQGHEFPPIAFLSPKEKKMRQKHPSTHGSFCCGGFGQTDREMVNVYGLTMTNYMGSAAKCTLRESPVYLGIKTECWENLIPAGADALQ